MNRQSESYRQDLYMSVGVMKDRLRFGSLEITDTSVTRVTNNFTYLLRINKAKAKDNIYM
jgi:hypothetical protein